MTRTSTRRYAARARWLAAAAIVLLADASEARAAAETWRERIQLGVALGLTQDDNLLQYSDGQIATFDARAHPDRYSIKSVDDLRFEPSVSLSYQRNRPSGGGRTIRLRWGGDFHGTNATVDHAAASVLWREDFASGRSISLGADRLPNVYVRQLIDEDAPSGVGLSPYRRASFALTTGSVEYRQRLAPRTTAFVHYRYERRAYNRNFRERSSDTHEWGLGGYWNPRWSRFDLSGSSGYRTSYAAAADGDEEIGGATDDDDLSYHGIVLTGETRVTLSQTSEGRLVGEIGYEFQSRSYTTDRESDSAHFNRKDLIADVRIGLRWSPPGFVSFHAFYQHENDHASLSSVTPPPTDPASYTANQIGASVEWGSALWQR